MGAVKSKVDVETIHAEVASTPVMIYTKDGCSFCAKAKELLNQEKIEYKECNVDRIKEKTPEAYNPRVNGLVYMTRQTTMPQIFICGKFVGGFTDLDKLRETRKLWETLAECTGENDSRRQG
ncbi:glutaredoxin [Oesophagostomum dentatum]|uniref:Glutaredoxin n=1 Tax=Oesophagostomum dentatum TaxID=61180 RepID=A0A0B1S8I0_OESDE|nr:glutaredoxin [Oesophagostomum dentatum]